MPRPGTPLVHPQLVATTRPIAEAFLAQGAQTHQVTVSRTTPSVDADLTPTSAFTTVATWPGVLMELRGSEIDSGDTIGSRTSTVIALPQAAVVHTGDRLTLATGQVYRAVRARPTALTLHVDVELEITGPET